MLASAIAAFRADIFSSLLDEGETYQLKYVSTVKMTVTTEEIVFVIMH